MILPAPLPEAEVNALKDAVSTAIAGAGITDYSVEIYIKQQGSHWIYNPFAEWNGEHPHTVGAAIAAALPTEIPASVVKRGERAPLTPEAAPKITR